MHVFQIEKNDVKGEGVIVPFARIQERAHNLGNPLSDNIYINIFLLLISHYHSSMSKRPIEEVVTINPNDFTTPEAIAFVEAHKNVLHYLFSIDEGGGGVTAFTWCPTADGAKVLFHLIHLPDDKDGYPVAHAELFACLGYLVAGYKRTGAENVNEALDAVGKILPSFDKKKNVEDTLGAMEDMPQYSSPPATPCIVIMCTGWC